MPEVQQENVGPVNQDLTGMMICFYKVSQNLIVQLLLPPTACGKTKRFFSL